MFYQELQSSSCSLQISQSKPLHGVIVSREKSQFDSSQVVGIQN